MESEIIANEGKNTLNVLMKKFNRAERVWKEMDGLRGMVNDIMLEN